MDQSTAERFILELKDEGNGRFTGKCAEYQNDGESSIAVVEGMITMQEITFNKQYIGENGFTHRVLYHGTWIPSDQVFTGTWKIKTLRKNDINLPKGSGTWIMNFDFTKTWNPEVISEAGKVINVHFIKSHFEQIFFRNGIGNIWRDPGTRTPLALTQIFGSLFILFALFAVTTEDPIFVFLTIGVGGFMIAALISFISAAKQVRAWKQNADHYIEHFTITNPWKLLLENDQITFRCQSMIDAADRDQMKGIEIAPDFVEIKSADNSWLIPKASIIEKEFDDLVGYLQYQMKAKGWDNE